MFNECLIHLCDCTCLNVLHILSYTLIKHKKIFLSVLIVFGKYFCFEKFQKLCNSVLTTLFCGSSQSRAYIEALGNSLVGQAPSREKDLEIFWKSRFLGFSWLSLATGSRAEALARGLLRMFGDSRRDLLASGPSSREKHLDKIFEIFHTGFWRLALATCSRLNPVAKNVCFAQWGLFSGQFSKFFHFFLTYCDCSFSPSSKLTVFTH